MTDVRGKPTNPPTVKNGQEDMTRRVSFKRKSQKVSVYGFGAGVAFGPVPSTRSLVRSPADPVPIRTLHRPELGSDRSGLL